MDNLDKKYNIELSVNYEKSHSEIALNSAELGVVTKVIL